jgi:hypothetical protein
MEGRMADSLRKAPPGAKPVRVRVSFEAIARAETAAGCARIHAAGLLNLWRAEKLTVGAVAGYLRDLEREAKELQRAITMIREA